MYGNVISGGIGCGKSSVANLLRLYGYSVIDADSVAHDVLNEKSEEIIENFGSEILENGKINRTKLGEIIFNNRAKKELLESILHPQIWEKISQQCEILEGKKKPYFMDIPLYFESKHKYKARFVICVYASKEIQLERIMKRNNLSKEEALKRIESQIDIESKRQKSDFVIENTSDLKTLQKNLDAFLEVFLSKYKVLES